MKDANIIAAEAARQISKSWRNGSFRKHGGVVEGMTPIIQIAIVKATEFERERADKWMRIAEREPSQIAAEAAEKICGNYPATSTKSECAAIIQSAIEKARTQGINDGYAAGTNDALSRAAHASES